jgi:hypothetical protein
MKIKLIKLTGNTAAIPVAAGPRTALIAITTETKAATEDARRGRSNHRVRARRLKLCGSGSVQKDKRRNVAAWPAGRRPHRRPCGDRRGGR